jgi:hypothetical protein
VVLYAVIDIHKHAFQAAVLDPESGEVTEERFSADRESLARWAESWRGRVAAVAIEANHSPPPPLPPATGCPSTPAGQTVPITDVTLPPRLTVDQIQAPAAVTRSTRVLTINFHVSDTCAQPVAGALVYATAIPYNQISNQAETPTGANGWATLTFTVLPGFPTDQHHNPSPSSSAPANQATTSSPASPPADSSSFPSSSPDNHSQTKQGTTRSMTLCLFRPAAHPEQGRAADVAADGPLAAPSRIHGSKEMPDLDCDTLGLATLRTAVSVGHRHSLTLPSRSQAWAHRLPARSGIDGRDLVLT